MGKLLLQFLIVFLIVFQLGAYASEDDTSDCDCETINISDTEEQNGCTASVKRKKL